MKYKIGLLIGRFQPFHKGHLYLIKKSLKKCERLVIGIGTANIINSDNPIPSEDREKIIKAVLYKEKLTDRVIKIIHLNDYLDDKKWLKNLKKQLVLTGIKEINLVIGNNEWTNGILEKAEYRILRLSYYRRNLFEGWRIRKLIREGKKWQDRVPGYIAKWLYGYIVKNNITIKQYNNIVLGGTFDRLHKGHKALIDKALDVGKNITIGLTTEKLQQKKLLKEIIEPYEKRKVNIEKYMKDKLISITPISDIYGTALTEAKIHAIVVSNETLINGLKINEERIKRGLPELKIIVIDDVLADDKKLISSERIRAGEIDRDGRIYSDFFKKTLVLSESFRNELRKPIGKIFKNTDALLQFIKKSKYVLVIAVGDIIVNSLIKEGVKPDVKIIDYKSRRKSLPIIKAPFFPVRVINKQGTINWKTTNKLRLLIQSRFHPTGGIENNRLFIVNGEEDLLALPAILLAPLNSLVLYGHWQLGIIAVEVDEKIKRKITDMLNKFI